MAGKKIGKVVHYYDKIGVAIIDLASDLKLGDTVTFKKGDTEKTETIESIQIERAAVESAKKGDVVGIKVDEPLKEGTEVYA
jgi:putative protease